MGGKTTTSTQQVQIPQDVLNRYNSVNAQAQTAASQPFQVYSTDPNAFVAPLTSTQQAGIVGTNAAAGLAQPYFDAATGQLLSAQGTGLGAVGQGYGTTLAASDASNPLLAQAGQSYQAAYDQAQPYNAAATGQYYAGLAAAQPLNTVADENIAAAQAGAQPYQAIATGLGLAGAQAVNPGQLQIGRYLSPYIGTVLGTQEALQNQQEQQAISGSLGDAIRSGAFGGDRAGLAAANVAQQLQLANNATNANILNQGYSQALGAAQQQQGVGLATAQANRAAVAGAAPEIAAIGQQGFGQGIATAEQQAALGQQEYGQQVGVGQGLANIGNQIYTQGMGLGQAQQGLGGQLFAQNLSQGAQEAGLGQTAYGMGAGTSAALAGLGTGAQGAALQGAQAQLAAGQAQQQTQQAGLSALYNQFLQQQSYPFQVSQFLANVAEGTGALSGSTTITQQPGGFFSDERLKESVKAVGETFDGQKIYSYRYKGDPRTQIGLLAHEVEKRHPEAVGETGGYRTVDYHKATKDASGRGHFADGGLAGYDPQLMQQILANAQGMYGPYLSAASGVGPYGGSGRVPVANLPVGQLKVAGDLPRQESGLEQDKQIADFAAQVAKGADWAKKHLGNSSTSDDSASDDGLARGGNVVPFRRGGLAGGGVPYSPQLPQSELDIPDEKPDLKLATAGNLPGQKSGLSDVKNAADTAVDIAKIAAMFMSHGGLAKRRRYADGGDADDDSISGGAGDDVLTGTPGFDPIAMALDVIMRQMHPDPNAPSSSMRPQAGDIVGLEDVPSASATTLLPTEAQMRALAVPPPRHAAPAHIRRAGLAPTHASTLQLADPDTVTPPEAPDIAAPASLPVSGLSPEGSPDQIRPSGGGLGAIASNVGEKAVGLGHALAPQGGFFDQLVHGKEQAVMPFLAALGAMGTAPTRSLGVALARGLETGALTYPELQTTLAEQRQIGAQTGQVQAQTKVSQAEAFNVMQSKAPSGFVAVPGIGPHGEHYAGPDGQPWHYELQVNAANFGSPEDAHPASEVAPVVAPAAAKAPSPFAPSVDTDTSMRTQYHVDPTVPGAANRARVLALNPELAPVDDAALKAVQARIGNLGSLDTSQRQLLQLSEAVNGLSRGTLSGQGHGSEYRTRLVNIGVTAANLLGVPVDPTLTSDLTEQQIAQKIRTMMGPAIANQNDERAASIAHAITGVLPGGDLQPKAANELLAQMLVQTQQPRDLSQYANQYVSKYGLSVGVEPAFQRDEGPRYGREQASLQQFMESPAFPKAMADLKSPDPAIRARAIRGLDHIGGEGFHRYFTLGQ